MDKLKNILEEEFSKEEIMQIVLSNRRKKIDNDFSKVNVKPVLIKDQLKYQFTYEYKTKELHKNLDKIESINEIKQLLDNDFKQGVIFSKEIDYHVLINKKGKINVLKKAATKENVNLSHNKIKSYIIEEGIPCDFLIRLGVMNEKGKVLAKKYDKFR